MTILRAQIEQSSDCIDSKNMTILTGK